MMGTVPIHSSTPFLLAVASSGTKTRALCTDLKGQVIGEGESGPTNLTATSVGAASFNLREAVRQATESIQSQTPQFACLVMGLSGMDTPVEQQLAQKVFADVLAHWSIAQFRLVHSSEIILESGTDNPNAVVITSGTGSVCFGRNIEGQTARTGGMDQLLTDQGSGYMIGRQILREAVKSFDGRRAKSILESLVCGYFHIDSIAELKDRVNNPPLSKSEIAELVSVGLQALEQGDSLAQWIFDHANESLVSMAATVVKKLQLESRQIDCVVAGSVMSISYIREHFRENMQLICPAIRIIDPVQTPVHGAVKLAQRLAKGAMRAGINSNVPSVLT